MDTGCRVIGHLHEMEWIENIDLQYKNRPVHGFNCLIDESVELDELLVGSESLELNKRINP